MFFIYFRSHLTEFEVCLVTGPAPLTWGDPSSTAKGSSVGGGTPPSTAKFLTWGPSTGLSPLVTPLSTSGRGSLFTPSRGPQSASRKAFSPPNSPPSTRTLTPPRPGPTTSNSATSKLQQKNRPSKFRVRVCGLCGGSLLETCGGGRNE